MSFEHSWMAHHRVIMVSSDNRVSQRSIIGNVNVSLISKNAGIVVPVREAGMEVGRDLSWEGVKGIQDQQIGHGGRVELIREGGVDEVDKECVGEESHGFVVSIRLWDMIWSAGQGIRSAKILAGDVFKGKIKFREVK